MHPRFKQRLEQVDAERKVHLCDKVMRWYTPLVLGGVMALCVAASTDHRTTRYMVGGAGAGAVVAGIGAAAYGITRRLRAPEHIDYYSSQGRGDVVPISRPVRYRPI